MSDDKEKRMNSKKGPKMFFLAGWVLCLFAAVSLVCIEAVEKSCEEKSEACKATSFCRSLGFNFEYDDIKCWEKIQWEEEKKLEPGEIWVYTPSGPFKHFPPNDYSLNFNVRVSRNYGDWRMYGNCFDQTIFVRHDRDYIYSLMSTSMLSEIDREGPLDEQVLANGYCYFYISIMGNYLPNLDGNTIYPPADFQKTGIPIKEIGQDASMQRLEKLAISLTSRKDPRLDVSLPITVVNVVGDEGPDISRYKAGSLVFKVEIPKEFK